MASEVLPPLGWLRGDRGVRLFKLLTALVGPVTLMDTTVLLVTAGCLLGIVQLAAGIAIGCWLRRPSQTGRDADLRRARLLALELHGMTQRIGEHVSDHRTQFEAAEAKLASVETGRNGPTTDLVVGVVGEILAANRKLQDELTAAENHIAEQAREIESHLTTSLTDPLTRLPNRRALDEQLVSRMEEYRKFGTPFSLVMLDADHFKGINDTHGHPVGDEVLVGMATVLRAALRKHDFVARYGGEEFAFVLPHTTVEEAERATSKAREAVGTLSASFAHLGREITASAGLASIQPGESIESLLRRADAALYMAKQHGRNRTYVHDGHECLPLDEFWTHCVASSTAADFGVLPSGPATLAEACDELRSAMLATMSSE